MSKSWELDPSTGDYKMEKGAPVPTDSLRIPAFYRIKIPRGGWMYAPDDKFGSDYHLVKKRSGLGSEQSLINIGEKALEPLVEDGRAVEAVIERDPGIQTERNNSALKILIEDSQGNLETADLPPIGG